MRPQAMAVAAALGLAGLLALVGLLERHEVGHFASSPQLIEVPLGARRIVGGGRALVGAVAVDGERVEIEIACRGNAHRVQAAINEPFDPHCGVEVVPSQILGFADDPEHPQRLLLSVFWDADEPDPEKL